MPFEMAFVTSSIPISHSIDVFDISPPLFRLSKDNKVKEELGKQNDSSPDSPPSLSTMYTSLSNGIKVFYREAGPQDGPVILLLHGFPASSFQFRNLIPLLSHKYRVVAPDLPGFGFTEVPESLDFAYTFANLTSTVTSFLDALSIAKFAVYIFDYGAPTGLRLMLQRPQAVTAIVSQNGNAYEAGLGAFWDPLRAYWRSHSAQDREALRGFFTFDSTRWQYVDGEPRPDATVDPAAYHLDAALLQRPGNQEIQLDLFKDYASNVALYPQFHACFRETSVPLLAVWGKNDSIFVAPGAEAFKQDLPHAKVRMLDAGHFAVESHTAEIAEEMLSFLAENGI